MQMHSANAWTTHMGIVGACCYEQQGKDRPLHGCDKMLDEMQKWWMDTHTRYGRK
jgi:hypothetical protein